MRNVSEFFNTVQCTTSERGFRVQSWREKAVRTARRIARRREFEMNYNLLRSHRDGSRKMRFHWEISMWQIFGCGVKAEVKSKRQKHRKGQNNTSSLGCGLRKNKTSTSAEKVRALLHHVDIQAPFFGQVLQARSDPCTRTRTRGTGRRPMEG